MFHFWVVISYTAHRGDPVHRNRLWEAEVWTGGHNTLSAVCEAPGHGSRDSSLTTASRLPLLAGFALSCVSPAAAQACAYSVLYLLTAAAIQTRFQCTQPGIILSNSMGTCGQRS